MNGKIIILILSLLLLASCKLTERKAKKQLANVESKYSYLFAFPCARLYPVKERIEIEKEYIKGDTKYLIDTQYVNCADSANSGKSVAVPCVSTHRVDTNKIVEKSIQESTAKVDVLRQQIEAEKQKCRALELAYLAQISELKQTHAKQVEQARSAAIKKQNTIFWGVLAGLAVVYILYIAFKNSWFGKIWKIIKALF